jgi:AcrR family transcriptional regulator
MYQQDSSAVTKPTRGRPKLALEDNETRERILNTAQRLFAQKGFDQVNLRELTRKAKTHLAAVNYYFGTKDQLLIALVKRASEEVCDERRRLLADALTLDLSRCEKVTSILKALLKPVISLPANTEENVSSGSLLARAANIGSSTDLQAVLKDHNSQLKPFVDALLDILPNVGREEICWQIYFLMNIEQAIHTQIEKVEHYLDNLNGVVDEEDLLDRVVAFAVPGLLGLSDQAEVH